MITVKCRATRIPILSKSSRGRSLWGACGAVTGHAYEIDG